MVFPFEWAVTGGIVIGRREWTNRHMPIGFVRVYKRARLAVAVKYFLATESMEWGKYIDRRAEDRHKPVTF